MKENRTLTGFEGKLQSLTNIFSPHQEIKLVEEEIYYHTAKNFGSKLDITDYNGLTEKIAQLGMGQVRVVLISDKKIIIQLYECFTCHDMGYLGKPICYFEGGILAGAVSQICGQDMDAIETQCMAMGDAYCEFELTPADHSKAAAPTLAQDPGLSDDKLMDLTLHSLQLAKGYSRVEHQTKHFYAMNQQLNGALKRALEINCFNETILDSIPNSLALMDQQGIVIKLNKQYEDFLQIQTEQVENKNIKALGWTTQYEQVLKTGNAAIWQETIQGKEYILFESPVAEDRGILRQLIPIESEFMKLLLDKISYLEKEMNYYKRQVMEKKSFSSSMAALSIDGPQMQPVTHYIKKVSKTDATVLLRGESGTGKSKFARVIHEESLRRSYPFVCIDCATIPKNFFEAELFGYEGGAYTGALKNGKAGKLEIAEGGTVFLDEVGEIPLEAQAKLLRFLQEKEFERMGGVTTKKIDVRIVAATNQDLEAMVNEGLFRKDLYYRLNVINVTLPPLRERWQEIGTLASKILLDFCREVGIELKEIDEDGIKALIHYDWPGNIRELENLLKRLAINADHKQITRVAVLKELGTMGKITGYPQEKPEEIAQSERELIQQTLIKYAHNKTVTAQKLGITRQTLYNKMKRYSLEE